MAEWLRRRSREQKVPSLIPRFGSMTGGMQNCPRQLAMQSCALCLYVSCGTSNQIKKIWSIKMFVSCCGCFFLFFLTLGAVYRKLSIKTPGSYLKFHFWG